MKKLLFVIITLILITGCAGHDRYYAIDHFYIPEEGEAFKKAAIELTVDIYNWYKDIEGSDGVYIIHYEHYDKEILNEWKTGGYMKTVPENELSYYVASANYLEDRGLVLSDEEKQHISSGVRLYLLPESLNETEVTAMKAYLTEDALHGLNEQSLIDTAFNEKKEIEFRSYHFDGSLEVPGTDDVKDPVIFVASCQNMKYFESESLIATGKYDSYIKLTEEAYEKYAKNELPQNLKHRKLTFKGISRINN